MTQLKIPAALMRGGTSKAVVVSRSSRPDCDVDYLFAAVAINEPVLDYSGSCGKLLPRPFGLQPTCPCTWSRMTCANGDCRRPS